MIKLHFEGTETKGYLESVTDTQMIINVHLYFCYIEAILYFEFPTLLQFSIFHKDNFLV